MTMPRMQIVREPQWCSFMPATDVITNSRYLNKHTSSGAHFVGHRGPASIRKTASSLHTADSADENCDKGTFLSSISCAISTYFVPLLWYFRLYRLALMAFTNTETSRSALQWWRLFVVGPTHAWRVQLLIFAKKPSLLVWRGPRWVVFVVVMS